jgi:hypothetical protein
MKIVKLLCDELCVDTPCVGRVSRYESSLHGHESFKINNPFVYQIWLSLYGSIAFCVCVCVYT